MKGIRMQKLPEDLDRMPFAERIKTLAALANHWHGRLHIRLFYHVPREKAGACGHIGLEYGAGA